MVISHGTYARLAVARGKPTLFYGQQQTPYDGDGSNGSLKFVQNYAEYRHLLWYPWDYDDGPALPDLLVTLAEVEPVEWKRRFIGDRFEGNQFVKLLYRLVKG